MWASGESLQAAALLAGPSVVRGARMGIGTALVFASCGGGAPALVQAPLASHVVVIPALDEEVVQVPSSADAASSCPPDARAEHGRCVRVIASPEIPTWTAPAGHLDPCATLTSDVGIYDCDPSNENPADGGIIKPRSR